MPLIQLALLYAFIFSAVMCLYFGVQLGSLYFPTQQEAYSRFRKRWLKKYEEHYSRKKFTELQTVTWLFMSGFGLFACICLNRYCNFF